MSAIADGAGSSDEPIQVLFALHPGFTLLHLVNPYEVLSYAQHNIKDSKTKAFECTVAAATPGISSESGMAVRADIDFEEAHERLEEFDVLIVPGGSTDPILKKADQDIEPLNLIKAFTALQSKDASKERTLLGICTGSLLLAHTGVLQGFAATTHPDHYTQMEIICKDAARRGDLQQTDVMEERYVVNNARFEVGDKIEDNPFVLDRRPDGRRKSNARKGSNAWKESKRRESIIRRGSMRLGGMRLITSGGVASGLDTALYLVSAMVSIESAQEVARVMQYEWQKGVTIDNIDV